MNKTEQQFEAFKARFRTLCLAEGGTETVPLGTGVAFKLPTHLGVLTASIHAPHIQDRRRNRPKYEAIYLCFRDYSTGKVYDSLCGYDFNGYSGKWNIHVEAATLPEAQESALAALTRRLGLLRELAQECRAQAPESV